jgi:hypothetical protein
MYTYFSHDMKHASNVCKRLTALSLSVVLLLFQTGCATHPYYLPPPLSEEARAKIGAVAIVSAEFVSEMKFFAHSRGRVSGAAKGMAFEPSEPIGFFWFPTGSAPSGPAAPGAAGGYAAAIVLGLILVGLLASEVYRAATAVSAEEVEKTESNLRTALMDLQIQKSYAEGFLRTAAEQVPLTFTLIEEAGPKTADERPDYGHLKAQGVDTVVELSVLSIGFEGGGGKDPLLWLLLDARVRVIHIPDGTVLYENMLQYRSAKRHFTQWVSEDGMVFSEELGSGYATLSEKIVEEVFLRCDLAPAKIR